MHMCAIKSVEKHVSFVTHDVSNVFAFFCLNTSTISVHDADTSGNKEKNGDVILPREEPAF